MFVCLSEQLVKGCLFVNVHCWSLSSFISLEEWVEVACVYLQSLLVLFKFIFLC